MKWNSSIYLKKINSLYRSSSNEEKSETMFKSFFDNKKHIFVKVPYSEGFEEKTKLQYREEDFKKTEIGLEYIGENPSFHYDNYIKVEDEYFVQVDTFDKVLNTFLEGFPLLEILNDNKGTFIAGGLFARLFIYFSTVSSFDYSDFLEVFDESDLDIYVKRENAEKFLKSMTMSGKQGSFYIIDVNSPTGYNTFLERNKITYRIRCCIVLENKKVPIDIMVTEEEPTSVISNFDLTAAQWGFDGNELNYFGTEKEDFFKRICHVNRGYIHDVLCGNSITINRLSKYSGMSFFIKVDETKQKIEKVSIDTDEFPNLHWVERYTYRRKFMTQISEEEWKKVEKISRFENYSSSLRNITQKHFYSLVDEDGDIMYYSPVNLERVFHQKLKSYGFSILKKWTFVKLFIKSTFHQQYVMELSKTDQEGIETINKYWLEMIFNTNGKLLDKWGMNVENPGWAGIINYLRQILNSRKIGIGTILVKKAKEYKSSFKSKNKEDLKLLFSNYNSLIAINSSIFQSTELKTSRRRELKVLYGSIKWLNKYFDPDVFVTSDKDYISNTLALWDVGGENIVSLGGLKWYHQPYDPSNNFFFVQLSWWNRGAMKERVLYCYNNFMNVNKIYPWFGCSPYYKSLFTKPTEQMWKPDIDFLKDNQNYYILTVFISENNFKVQPEEHQFIINTFVERYRNKYFSGSSTNLSMLRDLILLHPFFSLEDFLYEFIMASIDENENKILLCLDSIYKPEKLLLDTPEFDFSRTKYNTVFDITFEDSLMFEETTIEKYLKEDFRSFVIIVKGPNNYEDLITTSWIDKLPNGMDDYNKISNCYFKSKDNNVPHTIYRRFGNNRTLIAEDYLSRCAFSKPQLKSSEDDASIGTYMYWKKACDVYGKTYVPRGSDITGLLKKEQKEFIFKQIVSKETKIVRDTYLEEMCETKKISFYDYFVISEDENDISIWVPITEKMKNGDYSEQLLDYKDRIMLVDVEEINNGKSDPVVVGNPDFWCIDYPYNIFGYQGDIHTHLGASQHTDLERFSVRAEVNDNRQWDFEISNYFNHHADIKWNDIFYNAKEQIFGTPQRTMTVGNVPDTPNTLQSRLSTPGTGGRRLSYEGSEDASFTTPTQRSPVQNRSPTRSEAASTVVESPIMSSLQQELNDPESNEILIPEEITLEYLETLVDDISRNAYPEIQQRLVIQTPSEDLLSNYSENSERYRDINNRALDNNHIIVINTE